MDLTKNKLGHYFYITNMMTIAIVQGDDVSDMTRNATTIAIFGD